MATRRDSRDSSGFPDDFEGGWSPSTDESDLLGSSLEILLKGKEQAKPTPAKPREPIPVDRPTRRGPAPISNSAFPDESTRIAALPTTNTKAIPARPIRPRSLSQFGAADYERSSLHQDFSVGFELRPPDDDDSLERMIGQNKTSTHKRPVKVHVPKPQTDKTAVVGRAKDARNPKNQPLRFPKKGESIGGFRLLENLGRGAFARVYLAEDTQLYNRKVALKVSRAQGDEPRVMARFQHTHIVPIYSLKDDPETGMRLLCMPYYGGANLAQVLDEAQGIAHVNSMGCSLVEALDRVGSPLEVAEPAVDDFPRTVRNPPASTANSKPREESIGTGQSVRRDPSQVPFGPVATGALSRIHNRDGVRSLLRRLPFWSQTPSNLDGSELATGAADHSETAQPNRSFLRGTTFVRASVWIVEKLALGLEHAHSRHFLHRDIKPSNILITADGTPMLLDFNLAAQSYDAEAEAGMEAELGGTPPYMAPEHLDAFVTEERRRVDQVDERSDIYALGLILYEMIAGQHPFPLPDSKLTPNEQIRAMCKERKLPPPSLKAANAQVPWSLDAIVRKAMAPDPADRYQSASFFAEDLRRFLDDRPLLFTSEPSLKETVSKWARRNPRLSSGSTIMAASVCVVFALGMSITGLAGNLRQAAARLNLRSIEATTQECQFLLNSTIGSSLEQHQIRGTELAKELRNRLALGGKADWTKASWFALLSAEEQINVRNSLAELIVLEARARVALAQSEGGYAQREALNWAVAWLNVVEGFESEPTHTLFAERARYHAALGDADQARADLVRAAAIPLKTPRDLYLTAMSELARGRGDIAESLLNEAVSVDNRSYWSWFALGLCHLEQRRFNEAASDFSACSLILPKFAWSYLNRGYALSRVGRLVEARAAYGQALKLSPQFSEALVRRGLVELELNDGQAAESDFRAAIAIGRGDPLVRAGLAEAIAKQGRLAEAIETIDHVIRSRPEDGRWRVARGMIQLQSDRSAAETDFLAAIDRDPKLAIAHLGLARTLKGRDDARAINEADLAFRADPNLIDALELKMLLEARTGKPEARKDARQLLLTPTPHRIYNTACALSLLGEKTQDGLALDEAVQLLKRAFDAGFPRDRAQTDPDLAAIKGRW